MDDAVFTGKTLRIVDNYVPIFSTLDNLMYKLGLSPYFFMKVADFSVTQSSSRQPNLGKA